MATPSQLEQDIFRELISISVSKAGDAFSRITKGPIMLTAPEITFVDKPDLIRTLIDGRTLKILVQSGIKGDLEGNTLLFFSEEQISAISGKALSDQYSKMLRQSLFMEISNILTGSLVSQLANFLKINVYGSVPRQPYDLKRNPPGPEFYEEISRSRSLLVTVQTTFVNQDNELDLPFVIIMDVPSMDKIMDIIREKNKNSKLLLRQQQKGQGINSSATTG